MDGAQDPVAATKFWPLPKMASHAEFFANVTSVPHLRASGQGECGLDFYSTRCAWRGVAGFAGLGAVMAWLFWDPLGAFGLLFVPFMAVLGMGIAWPSRKLAKEGTVLLRKGELWLGRPELARVGALAEVRYVELREQEDPENDENMSCRIYVRIAGEGSEGRWVPLLEAICPLHQFARELARAAGVPLEEGCGWGKLPEAGTAPETPLVIPAGMPKWRAARRAFPAVATVLVIGAAFVHPILVVLAALAWMFAVALLFYRHRYLVSSGGVQVCGMLGRWITRVEIIGVQQIRSMLLRTGETRGGATSLALVLVTDKHRQVRLCRSMDHAQIEQLAAKVRERLGKH